MSINFANVKAITIPQGSVKSITSGGVTLWQVAAQTTTYRLLEYIKFNGNEYIVTDHKPTNNRYYYLNFEIASKVNDRFIFAAGGDVTDAGAMRCTVRTSSSYFQRRYGRNSSSNGNIGTVCNINTFYQLRFRIFDDFQAYFAIADSNGTVQGSSSVTAQLTPANMNTFGIMGYGQGTYASNLVAGKVYRYFYRIGDASGDLGCNAYPVQRKSDGRCGLYDTVTNTFYPMDGTQITWTAAGPTVTEEWTYGGYNPTPAPAGTTIPAADWVGDTYNHFWYYTLNPAFFNMIDAIYHEQNVRVKVTVKTYNPTENKTYTSSFVNTLNWSVDDGRWYNYGFNIPIQANATNNVQVPTFVVQNGGSGNSNATNFNNVGSIYNDYGSLLKDVTVECLGAV